ncbi:hypothetical protein EDC96DRAFT_550676 [Choanephora cucurbitarum]|nr:hypothetical protein EDC96DRAFT_550676 [Choanephora cucurbitarum]
MDRFLSDIFFRGLRDVELVQRIRGIHIGDRSLERVMCEALDIEAAHNPSVHPTVYNNVDTLNTRRSFAAAGSVRDSHQAIDDPMDCDVLHSRSHQSGSLTNSNKDNRVSRGSSFTGNCHYCSRHGHKISECRTRTKDLANYESKMKDKYRNNKTSNHSGFNGPGRKSNLNAIDSNIAEPNSECSHSSTPS